MKSDYEERQARRLERYEDLAEKNAREGKAKIDLARRMADLIPFGQPILIGHHSEKHDRGFRNRIHNKFARGFENLDKSKYYAGKAASVGTGGISSDDPSAIGKLREKLANLEGRQEYMKAVNKAHGQYLKNPASLDKSDLPEGAKAVIREYKPAYSWEKHPFAPYQLTNNGAEIRRVKERIELLERKEQAAETLRAETGSDAIKSEEFAGGLRIEENHEENRVFLFFPGKPSAAIREACKRAGFHWAKSVGAWSRFHSAGAVWEAGRIKDLWLAEAGQK